MKRNKIYMMCMILDGFFDEDLYQELIVEFLRCIRFFRDVE